MAPDPNDHVQTVGHQHVDHDRRRARIVGQIAIGHDIDVRVDIGEHAHDDMALALLSLAPDDRSCPLRDLASPVRAIVVVNVNGGAGECCTEACV